MGGDYSMNLEGMVNHFNRLDGGFWSASFGAYELRTAFQPVYSVKGGLGFLYGVEALARPVRGEINVPPLEFFAGLDRPGVFAADWTCLTLHLVNASAWNLKDTSLFVNLNPDATHRFREMAIGFEAYLRLAETYGIPAERIVVEITERRAGSDDGLLSLVQEIRTLGCRIAVDDFGIDGSSLRRVSKLKPEIIKIDRIWFNSLMRQTSSRSLVKAVVGRFRSIGAKVLFEGIETAEEFNWARECGADFIQGWLFGPATCGTKRDSVDQMSALPADESKFA